MSELRHTTYSNDTASSPNARCLVTATRRLTDPAQSSPPSRLTGWLPLTGDGAVREVTEEEAKCQFSTESNATQLLRITATLQSVTPFYEKDPNFLNLFHIRVTRVGYSISRYIKQRGIIKLCTFWNTKEKIYVCKIALICIRRMFCAILGRNVGYFDFRSSSIFSWFCLSIARQKLG